MPNSNELELICMELQVNDFFFLLDLEVSRFYACLIDKFDIFLMLRIVFLVVGWENVNSGFVTHVKWLLS